MKRIIQLLFCATFVIGLSGAEEGEANDQQAPTDAKPSGFRQDVQINLLQSLFSSIRDKTLKKTMILSLNGEELVQISTHSVNDGKITQGVELQGTNHFPCIPNIHQFKDALTFPVEGGISDERYKQAIYLPAGTHYQEIKLSPQKISIGVLVVCVVAELCRSKNQDK